MAAMASVDDTAGRARDGSPARADRQAIEAARIAAHRSSYARRVATIAGIPPGSDIEAALAALPREHFAGPPPWRVVFARAGAATVTSDPADLYRDVLVSLGAARGLNNGQPSLHALCLGALALRAGERVVHVGAGAGYYTAVLAMLVGATGRVDAFEIEPDLAARAQANLAAFPQVAIHSRSGAYGPLPRCNAIYVNAAAAEPLAVWLDALNPGGRLLFPLAPEDGAGTMLLVTRQAGEAWPARFLGPVEFVPCAGAQDEQASHALAQAFRRGHWSNVRTLHRNDSLDETGWCAGRGWWLGTDSL